VRNDVIPIEVKGILPSSPNGFAIFLGNEEKVFVINVDSYVGRAIAMAIRGERNERPLTHELMAMIFDSLSISVERVVINELRSNTYFARLLLRAENEVHKKIIEIDARPSDCLTLALQYKCPIYVAEDVWEEVEDMSELLEKMREVQRKQQQEPPEEPPLFGEESK
jgi:bifunctional DNase/RNase